MKNKNSRREFVKTTAIAGLGFSALGTMGASTVLQSCRSLGKTSVSPLQVGLTQQALPYGLAALEPVIDSMTMEIHYGKHAAAYAKNYKEAYEVEVKETKNTEQILSTISIYSTKMRNNCGGHYNHELFWKCMQPATENNQPSAKMSKLLIDAFGSMEAFKTEFENAAKTRFGSGWAWLVLDEQKKLKIGSTPNQDNPLMDVSAFKGTPLLGLDVWEHAYYLKYQNKRPEYVSGFWKLVNWSFVEKLYDSCIAK
jgi:superoxide dismutase, Fe-Mn family